MKKVILTCAVTGNAPFNREHPAFPVTPKQICAAVLEAAAAGASIAHVHVRDPETGSGSRSPALFKEVVDRVRDSGTDIIINLTGGLGAFLLPDPEDESRALPESDVASVAERLAHIVECKPEIASLDISTGNQVEGKTEFVYLNTTRTLREMAMRMQQLGVKPELEVFGPGDIVFGKHLIDLGLIDQPPLFQFVMGVLWGVPCDPESLIYMRGLLPQNAEWAALGIGREEMRIVAQAALLGGHIRVGLEDNLYLARGVFASNGQLCERARTIVESIGLELASPADTRKLLNLGACGH